jgi:probable HAF family extracellular repeat protein
MGRISLVVAAFLTIACTDNPVAPLRGAPRLDKTGGRTQLTGVAWEKSTTGVDMVAIGQYNGQYTMLIDINDNGLAVGWGYANTPEGPRERAISWKDGVFTDLGTLGGNFSEARQANNAGVIVGDSQDAAGHYLPVVWENGVIRELPRLLPEYSFTGGNAQSINERGDIAGNDYGHAMLWPVEGGVFDLGMLPGAEMGWGTGINRDGTVMGQSLQYLNPGWLGRPTIWRNGIASEVALPPNGRPIGSHVETGQMFNDAGDFLADLPGADPNYFGRPMVFRNGAFQTLECCPVRSSSWGNRMVSTRRAT